MKHSKLLTSLALWGTLMGSPLTVSACDCERLKACVGASQLIGMGFCSANKGRPGLCETTSCFVAGMQDCNNWRSKLANCEITERANNTVITWKIKEFIDENCASVGEDRRCH